MPATQHKQCATDTLKSGQEAKQHQHPKLGGIALTFDSHVNNLLVHTGSQLFLCFWDLVTNLQARNGVSRWHVTEWSTADSSIRIRVGGLEPLPVDTLSIGL